ncbi:triple tyrosine motif-containing protein [Geojedonia litorea]|uniref:Triple tyrosine motif-containing protein n=1 Tax=Geojedonia litorea TaxID=1268269 RepID=A0ABV9N0C9_9FLAO
MSISLVNAQELPPIQVFTPSMYNGENQNWGISQSSNKYIYVANNKGLLEFNGAYWKRYPSPNESIIRSVKVINDLIYIGLHNEFGYWKPNAFGSLEYVSLSKELGIEFLVDEEFWNIVDIDHYILFQSLNNLYIYDTVLKEFKIIRSKTYLPKMFKVDGSIYFQKMNDGIYKIENGEEVLISNDAIVQDNIVVNAYSHDNKLLFQTQSKGFYYLIDGKMHIWDISANAFLNQISIYSSIKLRDNSFALGTISKGLVYLSEKGDLIYEINQSKGVSNNTVLSLFEDEERNIWLGLDNGINCINMASPYKVFNDADGNLGTIYASAVYDDFLYLGTNQGLFYKAYNTNDSFKLIQETRGQVWCLQEYDNTLFCGHNNGTYVVKRDKVELICDIDGTWSIRSIPQSNKDLLIQGNYNGLYVLEKNEGKWSFRNKIQGFDISARHFEFLNYHEVFVSHEYKGLFKVTLNDSYVKAIKIETETSVDKGSNSSVLKYDNAILYAYKEGVYRYDKISRKFINDTLLSKVFDEESYNSGKLIADQDTKILWGFSKKGLTFVSPGELTNTPKLNTISFPYSLRKGVTGYESISNLGNNEFLLGSFNGYIMINMGKLESKTYEIHINSVRNNKLGEDPLPINLKNFISFKNKENNIDFTYSIAEFDKYLEQEYQYQLKGLYNHWSEWSDDPSVQFNNLPFGDYEFNVRGRVGNSITTNIGSYKFSIEKPWHLSTIAIILYVLGVILFSYFMHNLYKHYYEKKQLKLMKETARELELKKLENKEQLTRFENEKLQQDIESKNRELAISTMSLIKKNEFLNSLKTELKAKNSTGKGLSSVIKIIDRNLNNTDDWNLFQEAFNNADKDFLKKIKSQHPALTPNDLRLCAYLRLNLSSKEIAPLLNISPRSVEVKRYRLRKKMNLEHDESLTNYILEI